jgi:5-methylcytosine-specific restriction protein B
MKNMNQETLNYIVSKDDIKSIILDNDFYFQKGANILRRWLDMELASEMENKLLQLANDYRRIQEEAKHDNELNQIIDLLFEIIAYCDTKAKDKNQYNEYEDKRCLGMAFVRMNSWVKHLIIFKLNRSDLGNGSTKNAFNYLLDPANNATILSEGHRKLVVENLMQKEFDSSTFVNDLKSYFASYSLETKNPNNYTHLLSRIIYSISSEWKEEVVALMASDNTGWHDEHIEELENCDAGIIWNSKRPSGTNETLKFLRAIIQEGNSFNLYYCTAGNVNYKATVIDFVEDQTQLDEKKWHDKFKDILYYYRNFDEYSDDNKKARIVFLIEDLKKIRPISVSEFKFYNGYDMPRQDNLSPVKEEPQIIIAEDDKNPTEDYKELHSPLNQILFGPPGTGKTYQTINKALELIGERIEGKTRQEIKELFELKRKEGQIVFTTFHQSMSYEDFIEGIKPETFENQVVYTIKNGIFKSICQAALTPNQIGFDRAYEALKKRLIEVDLLNLKTPTGKEFAISLNSNDNLTLYTGSKKEKQGSLTKENIQKQINGEEKFRGWDGYFKSIVEYLKSDFGYSELKTQNKNYVLIIDEINRGNVSQIFGELITLIEEDKRLGKSEALEVILPYSKETFGVPSNVYIIGTMNTSDRSVEALDVALRRRFSFEEIPSRYDLQELAYEFAGVKTNNLLKTINIRIEKLLDKDHKIGHSYFILNGEKEIERRLLASFYKNIIPLLQEYFFGDYGKIGLVLGDGFVKIKNWDVDEGAFAYFNHESAADFEERPIYEIIDYRNPDHGHILLNSDSQRIEMTFSKAIKRLMNQDID